MKQLLWLCALWCAPFILVAQTNDLRPVALVQQQTQAWTNTSVQPLFETVDKAQKSTLALSDYHYLNIDAEAQASLYYKATPTLQLSLPFGKQAPLQLQLVRVERSSPAIIQQSTGGPVAVAEAVHYQGIIANDPSSLVAISILDQEVMGIISSSQIGGNWVLGPLTEQTHKNSAPSDYVLYQDDDVFQDMAFSCGTPDSGAGYSPTDLREPAQGRSLNDCVRVYLEVNYDIYQDKGSVQAAAQYVTALFNQVIALYANEQINMSLSEVLVWDQPSPFTGRSSGEMLTLFQNTRTSFNGDLAQLLSYRASGGIAVVNGLCHPLNMAKMSYAGINSNFQQIPTYSWSVMVVAHELGHLLGSQHTHACVWNGNNTALDGCPGYTEGNCGNPGAPSGGGTIMSYCHLSQIGIDLSNGFGAQPGALIRNRVGAANCLTACNNGGGGNGGGNPPPPPPPAGCQQEEVFFRLQLDTYSPETSWAIRNEQNQIVAQGGPYTKAEANQVVTETLCLPQACYTFTILDSYGDGICCTYGQGSYQLRNSDQMILANGGEFNEREDAYFCLTDTPPSGGDCTLINFNEYNVNAYGGNQDIGQYSIQDGGRTLYIQNNAWKSIPLNYEVTRNTMVSFDFKSSRQGEIHGLGLDRDNGISYGYTMRVFGTQNWGNGNYDNYPGNNGWKSYTIPLGEFYTGQFDRFFFVADHDGIPRNGNAWFRDVRIYEGTDCLANTEPESNATVRPGLEVDVFPNPAASDYLNVRVHSTASGQGTWQLHLPTGQQLHGQSLSLTPGGDTQFQVDIATLPCGTYLLQWRDDSGEHTTRFTKY